jgi:hypothetical protein
MFRLSRTCSPSDIFASKDVRFFTILTEFMNKRVSALLGKHKTKYPELEQYIEHVSASDRSIQILEDIKDPRRAHYIF